MRANKFDAFNKGINSMKHDGINSTRIVPVCVAFIALCCGFITCKTGRYRFDWLGYLNAI